MSTIADTRRYTPEELLALPDADRYELVDGQLVERHMGLESTWVLGQVYQALNSFCRQQALGWVFPGGDAGYQGFPGSPRTVRKPDVSFVRAGRFPGEQLPRGYARLVPDLAAEVVSPNDLYEDLEQKIEEYLRAGVRLVWVISPQNRVARVYRPDGSSASVRLGGYLEGEDVVQGFRCLIDDLFPPLAEEEGRPVGNGATQE